MSLPRILLFLISFMIIYSCKKKSAEPEEETPVAPSAITYPNYYPLKKGDYWIYERFQVEQNGASKSLNQFDSVYVEKDSLIRGKQFWKLKVRDMLRQQSKYLWRRDSLHYIVDESNKVCFSSEDFSTVFLDGYSYQDDTQGRDTLFYYFFKMNDKDLKVTTTAGTYTTSNFQMRLDFYPKYSPEGVNNPRYKNTRYAKNIGIIIESEDMFLSAPFLTERRLIRYKLN